MKFQLTVDRLDHKITEQANLDLFRVFYHSTRISCVHISYFKQIDNRFTINLLFAVLSTSQWLNRNSSQN
jgi:hypothetical protein